MIARFGDAIPISLPTQPAPTSLLISPLRLLALTATGLTLLVGCGVPAQTTQAPAAAPAVPLAVPLAAASARSHSMSGMAMPPARAASTNAPGAPATATTVLIQSFAFAPATVTVKAGTTITWTNQDQDPHTVSATGGGAFQSPALNTGDSYRYTFTTPGRYDYLCTIHPFMTATVVVTP